MSLLPKHRLIDAGFRVIAATGAARWAAPLARGRGVILTFHHVRPHPTDAFQPNALLSITPGHLETVLRTLGALGFDVVALDEVPARLAGDIGRPFAALTFDDGYRDNLVHAAPILRRHDAPWTMFVTADYASGTGRLWWLELEEVVRSSDTVTLPRTSGAAHVLRTRTFAEKEAAFAAIYGELRAGSEPRLRQVLARLCDEASIDREALVRGLCLGWDEIADLARDPRVAIGAHTISHPMLAKQDEAEARREIVGGRERIRERIGGKVKHLAYPVGDPGSAGPREFAAARDASYATAVTTRPGHLFSEHLNHLTALPRVSVNGLWQSESAVRTLLSGLPFLVWNRGRRLNVA